MTGSPLHQQARRYARQAVLDRLAGDTSINDALLRVAIRLLADRILKGRPEPGQCCGWQDLDERNVCRNCLGELLR